MEKIKTFNEYLLEEIGEKHLTNIEEVNSLFGKYVNYIMSMDKEYKPKLDNYTEYYMSMNKLNKELYSNERLLQEFIRNKNNVHNYKIIMDYLQQVKEIKDKYKDTKRFKDEYYQEGIKKFSKELDKEMEFVKRHFEVADKNLSSIKELITGQYGVDIEEFENHAKKILDIKNAILSKLNSQEIKLFFDGKDYGKYISQEIKQGIFNFQLGTESSSLQMRYLDFEESQIKKSCFYRQYIERLSSLKPQEFKTVYYDRNKIKEDSTQFDVSFIDLPTRAHLKNPIKGRTFAMKVLADGSIITDNQKFIERLKAVEMVCKKEPITIYYEDIARDVLNAVSNSNTSSEENMQPHYRISEEMLKEILEEQPKQKDSLLSRIMNKNKEVEEPVEEKSNVTIEELVKMYGLHLGQIHNELHKEISQILWPVEHKMAEILRSHPKTSKDISFLNIRKQDFGNDYELSKSTFEKPNAHVYEGLIDSRTYVDFTFDLEEKKINVICNNEEIKEFILAHNDELVETYIEYLKENKKSLTEKIIEKVEIAKSCINDNETIDLGNGIELRLFVPNIDEFLVKSGGFMPERTIFASFKEDDVELISTRSGNISEDIQEHSVSIDKSIEYMSKAIDLGKFMARTFEEVAMNYIMRK